MKIPKFFLSLLLIAASTLACTVPSFGGPLIQDDFSDPESGWGTGTDADSLVEYTNGGLRFAVYKELFITWSTLGGDKLSDIHVEVNVVNNSSDSLASFGILCHVQDDDAFYYFEVAPSGYYSIARYTANADEPIYLVESETESEVIKSAGNSMKIGADCAKDGTLTLYVNGQQIDSVNDMNYTSGYVGLFASTYEQPNGADVTFDDFIVTTIQK